MLTLKRPILFLVSILLAFVFLSYGARALVVYSSNKAKPSSINKKSKLQKIKVPVAAKKVVKRKPMKSLPKKHKLSIITSKKKAKKQNTKTNLKYSSRKPRIPYSKSDLDLLARLITAEAVAEPYKAKVAVGSVIINRIKSHIFASSIISVIYQKIDGYYQFTPTLNGWINKPATADSKKAAYEALNGSDPSKGALYYFDDSTTNTWLWSKSIKARIGKLVFAY